MGSKDYSHGLTLAILVNSTFYTAPSRENLEIEANSVRNVPVV